MCLGCYGAITLLVIWTLCLSTLWVTNKGNLWEVWKANKVVMNSIRLIMSPFFAIYHHRLFVTFTLPREWSLHDSLFRTIFHLCSISTWGYADCENWICGLFRFYMHSIISPGDIVQNDRQFRFVFRSSSNPRDIRLLLPRQYDFRSRVTANYAISVRRYPCGDSICLV